MVRFEKDKLVIEITNNFPADCWADTIRSLLRMVSIADKELLSGERDALYDVCTLLEEMLPDEDACRRLVDA